MVTKSQARHRAACRPSTPLTDLGDTITKSIPMQKVGVAAVSAVAVAGVASLPAFADSPKEDSQEGVDVAQVAEEFVKNAGFNEVFVNDKDAAWDTAKASAVSVSKVEVRRVPAAQSFASEEAPAERAAASVPASASSSSIVNIANRYLGVPYVYGGSTPAGFDCSGFTAYVYGQVGISLPHQSEGQAAAMRGREVSMANAAPGALMWRPGHVGIYLGNGMMMHAPSPGRSVEIVPVYTSFTFFQP